MNPGYAFLFIAGLFMSGCENSAGPDQCLRREIFKQCMELTQKVSQTVTYNDTDEIISECEKVAYYQSMKQKSYIPNWCRL